MWAPARAGALTRSGGVACLAEVTLSGVDLSRNRNRTEHKRSAIGSTHVAVIATLLTLTPAIYWTNAADAYGVVKWTAFILGTVGLACLWAIPVVKQQRIIVCDRRALVPVGAFLVAAVVATVLSDSFWDSLVGGYSYYQGLLTFMGMALVLVTVLAARDDPGPSLLRALTWGGGLAALLTGAQFAGILDHRLYGRVATTLGNSNFGAAYLALVVPAALYHALFSERSQTERWLAGGVAAVAALEAVAIGSSQGPFTLVAATGACIVLWSLQRYGARRTGAGVAVAGVLGAGGLLLAWTQVSGEVIDSTRVGRYGAWVSGWETFLAHPIVGVGLDRYEQVYPAFRPEYSAVNEGFVNAGQAHNVLLDLLADGGLLLGAAYLTLVIYTGYRAVRELRRRHADGDERGYLLFSAIVAVWVGYQVQSLVSIDHVPLALVHWVTMALIFRMSATANGRELVFGRAVRHSSDDSATYLAVGAVGLVALWFLVIPLRADLAAGEARRLGLSGRPDAAAERLETATSLMSFRPEYWTDLGLAVQAFQDAEAAVPYIRRGAELNAGNSRSAMMIGEYHRSRDETEAAADWYERALERDPLNPGILETAYEFYIETGDDDRAAELDQRLDDLPEPDAG